MATMDNEKDKESNYEEWILEAIDKLRTRKARPDANRICQLVKRKYDVNPEAIEAALDKLVESKVVIKVDYKGNISYRNGAKWGKNSFGNIQNSASTSSKLAQAVRNLTNRSSNEVNNITNGEERTDPPQVAHGEASAADIERWLAEHHQDSNLSGNTLVIALDREVDAYRLKRTEKGNFAIGDPSKKPPPPEKQEKPKKPKVKKSPADNDDEKMKKPRKNITPCPPGYVPKQSNKSSDIKQEIVVKQEVKSEDVPSNASISPAGPSKYETTETQIKNILQNATKGQSSLKAPSLSSRSSSSVEKEEAPVPRNIIVKPRPIKRQSSSPSEPLKTPVKNKNATRPTTSKRKVRYFWFFILYILGEKDIK